MNNNQGQGSRQRPRKYHKKNRNSTRNMSGPQSPADGGGSAARESGPPPPEHREGIRTRREDEQLEDDSASPAADDQDDQEDQEDQEWTRIPSQSRQESRTRAQIDSRASSPTKRSTAAMKESYEHTNDLIKRLRAERNLAEEESARRGIEIEQLKDGIESLKYQMSQHECPAPSPPASGPNAELLEEVAGLRTQVTELKTSADLAKAAENKATETLKIVEEELKGELKTTKQVLHNTEIGLQSAEKELRETKHHLQGTENALQSAESDLRETKKDIIDITKKLKDAHEVFKDTSDALEQRNLRVQELKGRVQQLKEQNPRYSQMLHDYNEMQYWLRDFCRQLNVPDAEGALRTWGDMKQRLSKQAEMEVQLQKLQAGAMASVDRHAPGFDETTQKGFVQLNKQIGNLVKVKTMVEFASPAQLPRWQPEAFFDYSVNPHFRLDKPVDKKTQKFLLRHVMWKFLSDQLFDWEHPFDCFGHSNAERIREVYPKMFPNPELNEAGARWRSLTAQQFNEQERDEDKKYSIDKLIGEFGQFLETRLQYVPPEGFVVEDVLGASDIKQKLADTLGLALAFARDLAAERAGFKLEVPNLAAAAFIKAHESESLTNLAEVGVDPGMDEEMEGEIKFVVSPMLKKYGSGSGQNLQESIVLMRGFAEMM